MAEDIAVYCLALQRDNVQLTMNTQICNTRTVLKMGVFSFAVNVLHHNCHPVASTLSPPPPQDILDITIFCHFNKIFFSLPAICSS
jgi:hypothetical protein